MSMTSVDLENIYLNFSQSISAINCGYKCAPYNHNRVPFCCDTQYILPSALINEWDFLRNQTNLWHQWKSKDNKIEKRVQTELPHGQVIIECLGQEQCQRKYRSISCRSFPFFPYINRSSEFIGISYYWEYADVCWIISNLNCLIADFLTEFTRTYELLFRLIPEEFEIYQEFSEYMRDIFGQKNRKILYVCLDSSKQIHFYKINPHDETSCRILAKSLPKYGPYKISDTLLFPDEIR